MQYIKHLPQDENYIDFCHKVPHTTNISLRYDQLAHGYKWSGETENIVQSDFAFECNKSLLLSAGAYTGTVIDHLLDGYSSGIILKVNTENEKLLLDLYHMPVESDRQLYETEKNGSRLKPGMFTSDMPIWKKLLLGNLFKFLCGKLAIERETAHQPIYYPPTQSIMFCSGSKYHSYKYIPGDGKLDIQPIAWTPTFPSNQYACMHPHYDQNTKSMLTYSFNHALLTRKTYITFYEFGDDCKNPQKVNYTINDRSALHMFGFTKHYFIVFANPLQLEKYGQTKIIFGKPILRALDDTYISNLHIHFIPRPEFSDKKPFSVDTTRQGFVYHTINCFETDNNTIIIDAFVSNLNAGREAAQFELDINEKVYDNNGDPYRFSIQIPSIKSDTQLLDPCKYKLIASVVDSTIDFHCINSHFNGVKHRFSWIVGHERVRNKNGDVEKVVSSLYKIDLKNSDLEFDSTQTVTHYIHTNSTNQLTGNICYLRTPMFVPKQNSVDEDDGYLFIWSYELGSKLAEKIIIMSAKDLEILIEIPIPEKHHIPYSVHSWIYPFSDDI